MRMDLQLFAQSPSFNYTALGVGVESTFGSAVVPSYWLSPQDFTPTGTNELLERSSARGNVGRELPGTGGFMGAGSATIETDPDMIGVLLALAMGAEQSVLNPLNPTAAAVATTLGGGGILQAGPNQLFTPAAMTNITPGVTITIDTAGVLENVLVTDVIGAQARGSFKFAHAAGVAITNAAVVSAYDHTYTLATSRKTATFQWNRRTDAIATLGNKISTFGLTAAPRAILAAQIATIYQTEVNIGSAAVPSFSTLEPFRWNDPGNTFLVDNGAWSAGVTGWSLSLNTGLLGNENEWGSGRLVGSIPEGQSRVSGSVTLQFTDQLMQQRFWGKTGATGPQSIVVPMKFGFTWIGRNYINSAVKYQLQCIMPQVILTGAPTAGRQGGILQQAARFEAFQSGVQTNDDLKMILTNTQVGVS